jgi:SSS family solute:Na+ symporter
MSLATALTALDWALVGGYGASVVGAAWLAQRRQRTSEDFLLGGRRLPWWVLGISIIATAFSALSLLGWTGLGFANGLSWIQLQAGELAAVVVVALVFLPWYARLPLTTAYEVLESRFGAASRRTASALFVVQVLLRSGILLYATAKALAVFTDLDVPTSILVVGVAAMAYSSVGGLGAVAWTDALQMCMVVGGLAGCIAFIQNDLGGGWGAIFGAVGHPDHAPAIDWSVGFSRHPSLFSAVFGYGVLALAVAATNQQPVQRYLACKDLGASRRALVLSWGLGLLVVSLTLFLGAAILAWNTERGGGVQLWHDGTALPTGDTAFPRFISERAPQGLAGLLVAAIFAAAMSSMDSAIHALATATLVDFVVPLRRRPLDDAARLRLARWLTLGFGVLTIGAALWVSSRQQGEGVINLLLGWYGVLTGPMLGLFVLARARSRVREGAALLGVFFGYAAAFAFSPPPKAVAWDGLAQSFGISDAWTALVGLASTVLAALLLDRLPGRDGPSRAAGHAPDAGVGPRGPR